MLTPSSAPSNIAAVPVRGARWALILLLLINLFNYIDRQVLAAVEVPIQKQFFPDSHIKYRMFGVNEVAEFWMGLLPFAFIVSYMIAAPIFGLLADRMSRWLIVGLGVVVWSLATGGSGLAAVFGGFTMLMFTRALVGIGEAGYGPSAPTLIADFYPVERRGTVLAWFYMAIPVGSALGYIVGMVISHYFHWSTAFYAVVIPGILLGIWAFRMIDPRQGSGSLATESRAMKKPTKADYLRLLKNPSYLLDCAGMAAMTFAIGGISYWMPHYLIEEVHAFGGNEAKVGLCFGAITVVAGLSATLLGGLFADWLRKRIPSSYFLVSGIAILIACPFILLMRQASFPVGWVYIFLAEFFLFFNTGPSNTILANVTHPSVRASAFALNILIIHALGDAISPTILGKIGHDSWPAAWAVVAAAMALAGVLWLLGCQFLVRDTAAASEAADLTLLT